MRSRLATPVVAVIAAACLFSSCRSAYYGTMEKFGIHKRDILVDRVEEGREDQAEAKEQFETTYERFKRIAEIDGGELEEVYETLNDEYERCESEAEDVRERIESIEKVAADLFSEWETELAEIQSADLRKQSEAKLEQTRDRYGVLIGVMQSAEAKMEPVLVAFRDHVLFLKHNLNAQAISSLQETVVSIEGDVASLIEDMQASIDEADSFISSMES